MILLAFEDDHGNQSLGPLLILGKRGPDPGHLLIEPVALLTAVNNPGAGLDLLGPVVVRHLDLDLWGCRDIPEPQRMVRRTTLRGHDDVVVSFAAINERGRDGLAALRPFCGHQQHVVAPHADPPPSLGVELVDCLLIEGRCFHHLNLPCSGSGEFARAARFRTLGIVSTTALDRTIQVAETASVALTPAAAASGPAAANPRGCRPPDITQSIEATRESASAGMCRWTVVSKSVLNTVRPKPPATAPTAIVSVDAGTASRPVGSARSASRGTPTRRGRAGCTRSKSIPPRTAPIPNAATMVDQAGAPPSERWATIGPSASSGARTAKLPSAEKRPSTQSHVRDRKMRHPARRSRQKWAPVPRAAPVIRIGMRKAILTRKVPASTASAHPGPVVTTRTPATTGPRMAKPLLVSARSAFACCSRSCETVSGTKPVEVGRKNASPMP